MNSETPCSIVVPMTVADHQWLSANGGPDLINFWIRLARARTDALELKISGDLVSDLAQHRELITERPNNEG